jgi:signal transduction histidine kinase
MLLISILAGGYATVIFFSQQYLFPDTSYSTAQVLLQIILAVVMALSFQPLRRWITRVTDRFFFKNAYDPEQLLDTLAHTIGATIVLIELCYKSLDLILSQIKITRGLLVILTDAGNVYTSQAKGYQVYPKIDTHDISRLTHDGIIVYDELEETSRYKHLLAKYNASVAIPLKTEGTTEGLLILGEKESGDMYSQNDLKVFEIIAPELAVAITNAKSYEKIEKFNVTLREEVKKATSELEKKNEQLRELDMAKDEFISMASHQLRTPLTAIKGYLSMLLEGDAGEIKVSQYDFVNEAFNGANRMVGLINDLLNVSRMETGRFFLEPVEVDMIKLVEEEIKQLQNNAKEKKLYLKFDLKKKKIPHIWVDETKMRQVVMNFIDNALYYTTDGGVTVSLDVDSKDIIFKVDDTGIGVPKAQQGNLFTKFYRADNARHVRPDGTGLGIYLAKRVMDDHGGQIIFHSVEGKGSTFGFKMPLKSKLKMKRVTAPAPGSGGTTPAIGELAAGIGVSAEALEATQEKRPQPEIPQDKLDIAKAAGVEAPLPDSADAKDMVKEADHIQEAAKK